MIHSKKKIIGSFLVSFLWIPFGPAIRYAHSTFAAGILGQCFFLNSRWTNLKRIKIYRDIMITHSRITRGIIDSRGLSSSSFEDAARTQAIGEGRHQQRTGFALFSCSATTKSLRSKTTDGVEGYGHATARQDVDSCAVPLVFVWFFCCFFVCLFFTLEQSWSSLATMSSLFGGVDAHGFEAQLFFTNSRRH